jgi:uncharacterized protein
MGGALPNYIEPLRLAEVGARLNGTIPVDQMPRLVPLLIEGAPAGGALIDFHFEYDAEGHAALTGRLSVTLTVPCQRCLQAMTVPIDAPVRLRLIRHESEAPPDAEVLLITAEPMPLASVVEEELLLNMPMTIRHLETDCPVRLPTGQISTKEHPLAALASLRGTGRQTKHPDIK